jgi:hypothetical protein
VAVRYDGTAAGDGFLRAGFPDDTGIHGGHDSQVWLIVPEHAGKKLNAIAV